MLKILDITNFTCFPSAKLKFSPGLNIVVGENGTGKSHLLKLGYAMLRSLKNMQKTPAKDAYARDLANHLVALFKPDSLGRLASRVQGRSDLTPLRIPLKVSVSQWVQVLYFLRGFSLVSASQ